ncbi:MAG: integral rane sensor signal transduction histidine kinase [Candidatus Solibacter sp.]|nr:integral rane sensor signal transduction histidine kinase [Candidatus Solibacter sp.]
MKHLSVANRAEGRRGVPVLGVALVGLLLTACPGAFALNPALNVSQYTHAAWKVGQSFPQGAILSIAQTPDGYLWLGTEFGLLRFDGVRSVSWPPNQRLPSGPIRSLLAAHDGTLWIGASKGLASWKDGKLTQYAELAGHLILALVEDREGVIWAGGYSVPTGRLCAIQGGSARCYGEDGSLGEAVSSLNEDSKGSLWVGVTDGLWRWKPGPPKFYPLAGELHGLRGLAEGDDGGLLIAFRGAIIRLVDGKAEEAYALPAAVRQLSVRKLLRDRDGSLWARTSHQGLVHIHQGRTDVFAQPEGLSGNDVSDILEDREGNIWVATFNGLDRFSDAAVATYSAAQGLSSSRVVSVLAASDGSIWLRTPDGLNRWNHWQVEIYCERGNRLAPAPPQRAARPEVANESAATELPEQGAGSLFQDDRGRIWASTLHGVHYLEIDRFITASGVPGGRVHAIAGDSQGTVWFAHQYDGLIRFRPGSAVQQISWSQLGHRDFADALAADPLGGGLWLGFFRGGVTYFKDGQLLASYTAADGLAEGRINDFRLDQDGTLWAASEGGLSRLRNGRVATLTSKNGLPCDAVHWSIEDDAHSFWLYTPCGLVRIARSEMDAWAAAVDKNKDAKWMVQAAVFGSSDGVRNRANAGGFSPHVGKSPDGKLWFFSLDGLSVIDPRHLPLNGLAPPVHIEQITADHKTYNAPSDVKESLPLPPLVRDLEIDYTGLSFVAPDKVRFRYKLESRDRDWQDAGNRRQAFYNDLPPGKYRFRVIACNNSGVWNEAGAFLDFIVPPAYYQTAWFQLLCVAAVLALLLACYRLRSRQLARQFNVRLEERVRERTRIAQELHDTLLQNIAGLCLQIGGLSKVLAVAPASAQARLKGLRQQGEECLREARQAVWNLRSLESESLDLTTELRESGERLTAQTPTRLIFCVEGEPRRFALNLREQVLRIGTEAIANSVRHARASTIEVRISFEAKGMRLRISDDGRGFTVDGASAPGHFGLTTMRERAQEIGAAIVISSAPERGTSIEVTVAL